jgi:HD-like signal output (HDOD) protein
MSTPTPTVQLTRLESVLQAVNLPIAVYDGAFANIYANPAFASVFGAQTIAANEADPAHGKAAVLTAQRGRFFESLTAYVDIRDGLATRGFPLCDNDGRVFLVEIVTPQNLPHGFANAGPAPVTTSPIVLDPHTAAWLRARLSAPESDLAPPMDLRGRIEKIDGLPCLPAVAQNILALSAKDNASVAELAHIVESDPMLAAQLLRWASSPFYGKRAKLKSVQDAINVVGFDLVINLALGVASMKTLQIPNAGPLGMTAIWRHSVYTATLMSLLADRVTVSARPSAGLAYLTGLLHNIGLFLLGHQFPREFDVLSRLVAANPEIPLAYLEKFAFGTDHARLGTWLLSMWGLPEDLCVAVAHHHNPEYTGARRSLAQLCLLADHALATSGIGDGYRAPALLTSCCDALGIAPTKVEELLATVLEKGEVLDAFATQSSGK